MEWNTPSPDRNWISHLTHLSTIPWAKTEKKKKEIYTQLILYIYISKWCFSSQGERELVARRVYNRCSSVMIFSAGYLALATRPGHSRRALRSNYHSIHHFKYQNEHMEEPTWNEKKEMRETKKRKKPARWLLMIWKRTWKILSFNTYIEKDKSRAGGLCVCLIYPSSSNGMIVV